MMKKLARGGGPLMVSLLAACGGSGEGLDENGRPGTGGGSALAPDFASIQSNVFTPSCSGCHAGAAAPLGLRLDDTSSYAMLVNAPSVEVPAIRRVAPGNPDASYLIQKIEGRAAVGGRMPLGQAPLTQGTIDVIRQWIMNGAPRSPTSVSMPERFTVVVPTEDEIFTRTEGAPLIAMSEPLDPGSFNSENLVVERTADGVPLQSAQVLMRTPTVLEIKLPAAERAPGEYRLRIRGTGLAPVLDAQGQPYGRDLTLHFTIEDLP